MTKRNINGGVVKWLGDGGSAYVPGVPQRDLTAAEWEELAAKLRRTALATGLYAIADGAAIAVQGEATAETAATEQEA